MDDTDIDAPPVPRRPLASGVNVWNRVLYDASLSFAQQVERHGVEVTCESCGATWRVHPSIAPRTRACSTTCRVRAWRARQRGDAPQRPLWPMPWNPKNPGRRSA